MTIQDDDVVKIDVERGVGCTIRCKSYKGMTIVIDEMSRVVISSSHKIGICQTDWNYVTNAITKCIAYMNQVRVYGYSSEVDKKPQNIATSKQKDLALYMDKKGRGIFIIGKATIISNTYGLTMNRSGAPYLRGVISDASCITSVDVISPDLINITTNKREYMSFDSYASKPVDLIEEIWSAPKHNRPLNSTMSIAVNGEVQIVFRR